jgi:DNA-directed RNA polymerase subunit M/transcription elongation factor TFIIS
MDIIDEELNKKLKSIKKKFDDATKNSVKNATQKIEEIKFELINNFNFGIQDKKIFIKKFFEKKYNMIPKIQLIPDNVNDLNYFLNAIILILANLETISYFCLEEKYKEITKKLPQKNDPYFIVLFIDLIKNMYLTKNNNVNIIPIHNFLKTELNKEPFGYICQTPVFLINKILYYLESDINKTNERNIITNNFSAIIKTAKFCSKCKLLVEISTDKKIVFDLFIKETMEKDVHEEMKSIFKPLLKDEQLDKEKFPCPTCKQDMTIFRTIENPKNYLIFNINRNAQLKNPIKIKYSTELKLTEEKNDKEYEHEYELILVLSDKNNDQNNYVLFFKNFINDKWYKLFNGKNEDVKGNIKDEINKTNPNILIYKKKFIKLGK